MPSLHRRHRQDKTVLSCLVGVGGVNWALMSRVKNSLNIICFAIHCFYIILRLPSAKTKAAECKISLNMLKYTLHVYSTPVHLISQKPVTHVRNDTLNGEHAAYFQLVCDCLLYTSPSPRDGLLSRMPSSA